MKRQRSYGDGLDDDRRRFYDRGPPPAPPPRRPPRDYDGDRFDRRKGFGGGGGGFHDSRYREYPSPREYGGDRAMHRSESFSGFRREFPKGFRSERDRSRRDGDGSSAWRRPPGGGWRDAEGLDEYRAPARLSAPSLPAPPRQSRSRSRSPSEPRRRLEVSKAQKLRKQGAGASDMEEGEVAPDAEPKARAAALEHRKQVEPSRAKEKGLERGKLKRGDSGVPVDFRTQAKGTTTGASDPDNAGEEEGKRKDDMAVEAGKAIDNGCGKSALCVAQEVVEGHEVRAQDVATGDASNLGLSTSAMQQEVLEEEVKPQEETTNSADVAGQSTSPSISMEGIQEEAATQDETTNDIDEARKSSSSSLGQGVLREEPTVLQKSGSPGAEIAKSISPIMQQEMLQEEVALDSTACAVDEVGKSAASAMPQEVLQEEVMQHDGIASDIVDRVETGTCPDLQREEMQEKVTMPDEIAHNIDTLEPVSYSGMLKEAMHEGRLMIDGVANTDGAVGQSNSSDMAEEAIHRKAAAQEGTTNAVNSTGESNPSTGLQGEAVASLYLGAPENKEFEKLTVIEEMDQPTEYVASQPVEEGLEMDHYEKRGASEENTIAEKEAAHMHENVEEQVKRFDTEAKSDSDNMFVQPTKEHAVDSKGEIASALMTREPMAEDKGNVIAFDVLSKNDKVEHSSSVGRGLDSTLQLGLEPTERSKSASTTSVKQESDAIKIGKLDLSLSLSGCLQNSEFKRSIPKTGSLVQATCSQPLPPSFCTNSDGFTASNSQTVGHNPSCSLTQPSVENYEHSVGSKPLFMGVDQMSNWQAQLSSESTQKRGVNSLLQRALHNGHMPENTLVGIKGHNNGMYSDLRKQAGIPGVLSPTHSRGSHDSGLEHNRHRRKLTREKSSSSLTRGEQQEGDQLVISGAGVIERIITKIVSEPLHLTGRMLHEMADNSITYLREAISEFIVDPDKRGQLIALQEVLKKRSDLNGDMLRTCPRVLIEALVAIRTGLPYFIKRSSSIATSNLVDIFLNLKCCNLSCQSILPVDDCDCKFCQRKTGFCSSCMCIVCSKFDSASNTCSWVGCDVCLHWCHTDCGLRHSLIRKGQSASRAYSITEMQFHCAACGHPSEMFGFVKEVFRTCATQWRMDTLIRELQYVQRIFSSSDDVRGKRVRDFVRQMLTKLENKAYYPEVVKCVIAFFSDDDANLVNDPSIPLKGIPCSIAEGIDGIPSSSRKAAWIPFTLEGLPVSEKPTILSTAGSPSVHRKSGEAEFLAVDNKPVIDELDSLIRLKQAEACMYQERANNARNEVDNLRHIVMVKNSRIEEDYATRIADLDINELQERRKRKIEELQVIERTHHQFLSMKNRMVASIRELLSKVEALKQN